MKRVTVHGKVFQLYIPYTEIDKAISDIAYQMNIDFGDSKDIPLFVSVLNGSFMFTADLMKKLTFNCELSFLKMSSYSGLETTGTVTELIGLDKNIEGRTIILVEDIVDTGVTLETLVGLVKKKNPKEIRIATMLYKPESYTKDIKIDYIGKHIPNNFIVGYGLDYDGLGRQYPDLYSIVEE